MRFSQALGIIIVALLISAGYLFNLYGDWLWYSSVGYPQVLSTIILGSLSLALVTGVGFFAFSMANVMLARRLSRRSQPRRSHLKKSGRGRERMVETTRGRRSASAPGAAEAIEAVA